MNSSERRSALSIALIYVFRMLGLFMVLPVLPLYGNELRYATPKLIGVALGAYGLSQALLQIPFGFLSDRWGRKAVIAMGLLIFIFGSVVAANSDSIYGIILGRFLQGGGAIASTMMALVSDLTRIEQRTKVMAIVGISIGISFAISLVAGPYLNRAFGLSGIFWATAILGSIGLLVILTFTPTPVQQTKNRDSGFITAEIGKVLRYPGLLRIDTGIFLLHFNLMAGFVGFPLVLRGTGAIADTNHYLVYLVLLVGSFIVMGPVMMLSDKSNWTKRILMTCAALFVAAYAIIGGESDSLWWVCGGLFLYFMAFNLLEIVFPSLLSKLAPAGTRGTAMGAYSTMQFLGAFSGGVVGGWILDVWDLSVLFQVNALVCLCWFLSYLTMDPPLNLASRTLDLKGMDEATANQLRERLSSLAGVAEVVVIDGESMAYLKVDNDLFDDASMAALVAAV